MNWATARSLRSLLRCRLPFAVRRANASAISLIRGTGGSGCGAFGGQWSGPARGRSSMKACRRTRRCAKRAIRSDSTARRCSGRLPVATFLANSARRSSGSGSPPATRWRSRCPWDRPSVDWGACGPGAAMGHQQTCPGPSTSTAYSATRLNYTRQSPVDYSREACMRSVTTIGPRATCFVIT